MNALNTSRISRSVYRTLAEQAKVWSVVLLLALGCLVQPLGAEELPFLPVWIDGSGTLAEEEAESLVADFARMHADPEHIVVWVHGFDTTRKESTEEYTVLTGRLDDSFKKLGQKVAVVGIQWDSTAGGFIFALPGEYKRRTLLARKTGRNGVRTFLLALQERFPKADISMFGHSMGCEVTMAAIRPKVNFTKREDVAELSIYKPEVQLRIHAAALLGADLNYNIGSESRLPFHSDGIELLWMTEDPAFRKEDHDEVLNLRKLVAGKALGASFPLMTEQQYDGLLGNQVAVFDNRQIPRWHHFLLYYDKIRIDRLVRGLLYKAKVAIEPPPELSAIAEVMEAPDSVEALTPFLDDELLSSKVYALWRLEHHFGSGSKNFANGYLQGVVRTLTHRPKAIRHIRPDSPSTTVRDGIWPTQEGLARAGYPAWASPGGSEWEKNLRGEVTHFKNGNLTITTEFGDVRFYNYSEETSFTPSQAGLRIGSKVEVKSVLKQAQSVKVIPFYVWIKNHTADGRLKRD